MIIVGIGVLVLGSVGYVSIKKLRPPKELSRQEIWNKCIEDPRNVVLEALPRQCRYPSGLVITEPTPSDSGVPSRDNGVTKPPPSVELPPSSGPKPSVTAPKLLELEALLKIDFSFLDSLARGAKPDAHGAISLNQQGYFHVRFQMGLSSLVAAGLVKKDLSYLTPAVKAIEYSFQYQNPDGAFQFLPPPGTSGLPTEPQKLEYAQASGVAFFYSDLGRALMLMKESEWFRNSKDTASLRARIEALRPAIAKSLTKLTTQTSLLKMGDERDTNRLFFDAAAHYLVGTWLNDKQAIQLGIDFINMALGKQRPDGVFVEAGGYDSSYQVVSLGRALVIYFHLRPEEEPMRSTLWPAIKKGVEWEATRVLPSGEISTEGNSRVFPGGGTFLGKKKEVDTKGAVLMFRYFTAMTGDASYSQLAEKIVTFYSKAN